ncbi:M23 family metallopeptidase [Isoptericola haloaureus]|uniref:M23 family metallopeptidase n=1 Tax=Isoptericola haloaureus TaxID=1542902 RepID=A0ABU7Z621_9MICO
MTPDPHPDRRPRRPGRRPRRPVRRPRRSRLRAALPAAVLTGAAVVLTTGPAAPAPPPRAVVVAAERPVAAQPPAARERPGAPDGWRLPLPGPVRAVVDLPAEPWRPGHRGVDLPAAAGSTVRAPRAGTVTFAGQVGGKPVVVVAHGALRSTFEPAVALVEVGGTVRTGRPVAVVAPAGTGHCAPGRCLHWGVRRGDRYLDPLVLVGRAVPVVLLPHG